MRWQPKTLDFQVLKNKCEVAGITTRPRPKNWTWIFRQLPYLIFYIARVVLQIEYGFDYLVNLSVDWDHTDGVNVEIHDISGQAVYTGRMMYIQGLVQTRGMVVDITTNRWSNPSKASLSPVSHLPRKFVPILSKFCIIWSICWTNIGGNQETTNH